MTKNQIAKAAAKMVASLEWDAKTTTFRELDARADAAFDTDKGPVLDGAIAMLFAKEDFCKAAYNKLLVDLGALGLQHLEDGNVASENMDRGIVEGTVFFWTTFYSASCQVVACNAENEGIDITAKLGYAIH